MSIFRDILKQYWGYDSFRSLQEEIISSVYQGKDTLGLMPTGGGKSLTFQVPTLLMDGICVVVTPLIALMKDQVDNLRARGIKATSIHSGMSRQEILVALDNCIYGNYKFLYVAPERLSSELFLIKLRAMNVCLLAIDESHCISQWGYDFRPSYLQIASLRYHLPKVPVLALTATATEDVVDDIQKRLHFAQKNVFRKSFERTNISYIIRKTEDKLFEIIKILNSVPGSAIVYVRSRKFTKDIATELQRQGIDADFFHAGLTSDEKVRKQNEWKNDECRVIVATNAFGMGIDKPNVRVVIHYELPGSLEEYFQEAGRAGRDGMHAYAVALFATQDATNLKKRISDEFPSRELIKDVYEKLAYYFQIAEGAGLDTGHNFYIDEFCRNFKYNKAQAHSALRMLSLSGYIDYIEDSDRQSRLMFTVRRDDLYAMTFKEGTESLIQLLLRSYTGLFSEYAFINEELLAQRTGLSRDEVYNCLKYLSATHIIHYIPAQKVPVVYYRTKRIDKKYLSIPREVYEFRKDRFSSRVSHVIHYASSETECRSKLLLAYFGEKHARDCGGCDVCIAKKRHSTPADTDRIIRNIQVLLSQGSLPVQALASRLEEDETHVLNAVRYMLDHKMLVRNGDLLRTLRN